MLDASELWRKAHQRPKATAFVLFALAGLVAIYAFLDFGRRVSEEGDARRAAERVEAATCKTLMMPKKSFGMVDPIPPGFWCIYVPLGETLEVRTSGHVVEVATSVETRFDVYYHDKIVKTATIGKGFPCVDLGNTRVQFFAYTPLKEGGTFRVRVGNYKDTILTGC